MVWKRSWAAGRKEETERGLAVGAFGVPFPEAGGGCRDLWTRAGLGRAGLGIRLTWEVPQAKIFKWS